MDYQKQVIESLTQGKEFAKQLQIHLNNPNASSHQTQQILIDNILNSYNNSLSLLFIPNAVDESLLHAGIGITRLESQSPYNKDLEVEFKDLQDHKDFGAKRKNSNGSSIEKWKNEVKVRADTGVEEGLDDGYSWSKYGQKHILGAKHPRGYYRCTSRQLEGCPATKHVQRTDDDPNIFNVAYRGSHTCNPATQIASTTPMPLLSLPQANTQHLQENQPAPEFPEILLNFDTSGITTTENVKTTSFRFPSTSNNRFIFPSFDNIMFDTTISSPSLISPATPGSAYFTMSQSRVSASGKNVSQESELNNVVSVATSSTSSHSVDVGFQFGQLEFSNDFNFDNLLG